MSTRGGRATARLLLVGACLWLAAWAIALALRKPYSIDELDYAHMSWSIAHGAVPYRDFFDHHFPLLYQLLAVFFVGSDDPARLHVLRQAMLLPLLVSAVAAVRLTTRGVRNNEARIASAVTLFALAAATFLRFATEIRPDALAIALFLAAVSVLDSGRFSGARRAAIAGALLGAGVWASQKVLVYGAGFALLFVADVVESFRAPSRPSRLAQPGAFLAGFVAVVGIAVVSLAVSGALGAWWIWCFRWSAVHESLRQQFSPLPALRAAILDAPWLPPLAMLGIALAAVAARRARAVLTTSGVLALALLAAVVSFVRQVAPHPYGLLPAFVLAAIFAGRGAMWLAVRSAKGPRGTVARLALASMAVLMMLGTANGVHAMTAWTRQGTAFQDATLRRLVTLTAPNDPVYANSGSAVTRPHVDYFFFTNWLLRATLQRRLVEQVPREIIASGCVAWIADARFATLPLELRRFLTTSFAPYDGDLWLWGHGYPAHLSSASFFAVVDGEYVVDPPQIAAALRIDDRPATPVLHLARGSHRVQVVAPQSAFFLLWLPRDGRRWSPHPGVPRFSRIY